MRCSCRRRCMTAPISIAAETGLRAMRCHCQSSCRSRVRPVAPPTGVVSDTRRDDGDLRRGVAAAEEVDAAVALVGGGVVNPRVGARRPLQTECWNRRKRTPLMAVFCAALYISASFSSIQLALITVQLLTACSGSCSEGLPRGDCGPGTRVSRSKARAPGYLVPRGAPIIRRNNFVNQYYE